MQAISSRVRKFPQLWLREALCLDVQKLAENCLNFQANALPPESAYLTWVYRTADKIQYTCLVGKLKLKENVELKRRTLLWQVTPNCMSPRHSLMERGGHTGGISLRVRLLRSSGDRATQHAINKSKLTQALLCHFQTVENQYFVSDKKQRYLIIVWPVKGPFCIQFFFVS